MIFISFALIILFAFLDSIQINAPMIIGKWDLYERYQMPVFFWLWTITFLVIAIIYYLFARDISESIAVFLVPWIWTLFGVQDLFYFIFSSQSMTSGMCWMQQTFMSLTSRMIGLVCPTKITFIVNALIGLGLGVLIFLGFKKIKKWGL